MPPNDDSQDSTRPEGSVLRDPLQTLRELGELSGPSPAVESYENRAALSGHLLNLRLMAAAMRARKTVTAAPLNCTSAGVLAVLSLLSAYFE